jgi:ribosomal protein S18 acetylase RimI-like enzyme
MWLAESHSTPVGLTIFGPDTKDANRGRIEALYVDPPWQRLKDVHVGTRLLEDAVLKELGYTEIVLECATQNQGGIEFWKASGFKPIGKGKPYRIPGYPDVSTTQYLLTRESALELSNRDDTDAGTKSPEPASD